MTLVTNDTLVSPERLWAGRIISALASTRADLERRTWRHGVRIDELDEQT